MTRVFSYNILIGGTHRVEQLLKIIRSRQPDIVGLIEATNEQVVKDLARHLDMEYELTGRANDAEGWQAALLSRFPIIKVNVHSNTILKKQPLLEVTLKEDAGTYLTVFVTHLTADFGKGRAASRKRRQEVYEILRIMSVKRGTKHILIGDFNSLAPGEHLKGSSFLRYVNEPDLYYQLQPDEYIRLPDLNFVLPSSLLFLKPIFEHIPKSKFLSYCLDKLDILYTPHGGIDLLYKAGYVDCFRAMHPDRHGYTWPAPLPAGRVDFIFASAELANTLIDCDVVVKGEDVLSDKASDHLPVFADFYQEAPERTSVSQKTATGT